MTTAPPAIDAADVVEQTAQLATDKRVQRNILIAMCTSLVAVVASVSGLNVAQQALAADLNASQSGVLWIINAYTLALAALLMPVGAIGDRWGRKPVLLTGLGVFGVANVAAAFAQSTEWMIAARSVAGIGAAMIMPVTLSVVTSSFPPEDRARAIGVWAGFAGSGGMIGLFVSAFMVDQLSWRWTYLLPLTLVLIGAYMTVRHAPNSKEHTVHRFDTFGSVLAALAIGGIVLGFHEGPELGWRDPITMAGLIIGVVSIVVFVFWERRHPAPLLDISTFRDRALASGTVTLTIVFAVMFGIFLVLFPYFQAVVGWSALRSAAGMLPMALIMMPTSTVAPHVANRFGTRNTMLTGVVIFSLGLVTMAMNASVEGGYMSVLPGLLLIGLGMGLTMTPATASITETLPEDKQGVASALNDTSRELGGAVGMALLGSVLSSAFRTNMLDTLKGFPSELAEPASEGIANAYGVAAQAGEQGPAIIDAAKHAFVDAWVHSMWVGVAIATVAALFLLVRGPKRVEPTESAEG